MRAHPQQELHVVADNLNIHKNEAAHRWLKRHKLVTFHYTPTHASLVNLIECFFSILSKQGLAHSVQRSKQDLKHLIQHFIAAYNANCGPFTWTRSPEQLQRIIQTTKSISRSPQKTSTPRTKQKRAIL